MAVTIDSLRQSVRGQRIRWNHHGRRVAAGRRHDRRTHDGGAWHDGGLCRPRQIGRLAGVVALIHRAGLRRVVATTTVRWASAVARSTAVHAEATTTTTEATAADRRHREGQASQYECDLLGHEESFVFDSGQTGFGRGDDHQTGLQPVGEPACLMGRPSKRQGYSSETKTREEQFPRKLPRVRKSAQVDGD